MDLSRLIDPGVILAIFGTLTLLVVMTVGIIYVLIKIKHPKFLPDYPSESLTLKDVLRIVRLGRDPRNDDTDTDNNGRGDWP